MPKILLVTTVVGSCADRLAGALAGAEVEAVAPSHHAIMVSRHLSRAYPYYALMPMMAIRNAIAAAEPDWVIPSDDRAARLLAQIHAQGGSEERTLLERSLGAPQSYPGLYQRQHFIAEAARAGVPVAGMLPASDAADLERGLEYLGLPLVIKSDSSCGGEGVAIAHTAAEARGAWHRLGRRPQRWRELARVIRRRDLHFLASALNPGRPTVGLQRFIAGRPATSSFLCRQGEVLAANHFDVEMSQHDRGPSTVLTRRDCAQMDEAARRIARHFGLSGMIGLDFIRDGQGQVHLLEINPRATPTSHLALGAGHDPCGALLEQLGVAHVPRPAVTHSRQIALFPQEWRRAPDSPWLAQAFHDVPWDDPAVLRVLVEGGRKRNYGRRAVLNDSLAGEFDGLLASPGAALTIRQSARQ
jgi:hypothetical protein